MTTDIRKRLDNYIKTLPRQVRIEFRAYRKLSPAPHSPAGRSSDQPYWILLPQWLHRRYRRNRFQHPPPRAFLRDILWGQYCLFLSVRIHDDLFDGHARLPSLIFAADQLLLEAEQTFSRWMPYESAFWKTYRSSMRETVGAILRVDELQRSPATSPRKLIREYADVNAVLKISSLALCLRYKRLNDVPYVDRFMNNIAVGSQLLDDFRDLAEDFKGKRFNYVALKALHVNGPPSPRRKVQLRDVTKQLLFSDVTNEVMGEILALFSGAYAALEPLQLAQARRASKRHLHYLTSMRQEILLRRAKLIFRKHHGGSATTIP